MKLTTLPIIVTSFIVTFVLAFAVPTSGVGAENCTDSDGGKNPFMAGSISSLGTVGGDHCTADGQILYEYFCNEKPASDGRYYDWMTVKCAKGCFEGACRDLGLTPAASSRARPATTRMTPKKTVTIQKTTSSVVRTRKIDVKPSRRSPVRTNRR